MIRARGNPKPVRGVAAVGRVALAAAVVAVTLAAAAPSAAGAQTWTTAPLTPFAFTRFDAEYSLTTGRVFFLGGRLASTITPDTDGSVWSYDPVSGVYADTNVDMPTPVSNYQIARIFDASGVEAFVLFGGRLTGGGVVTTVQAYYPATNVTRLFPADPLPIATSPGGIEVVAGLAYVFGGFDAAAMSAATYIFDINAADGARWTDGPDLSEASSYQGTAVVDGIIYAIGGATWDGANLFARTRVERLDTTQPVLAWDDAGVADLPVACDEMRATGFDTASGYELAGQIVVAGCGQWPTELAESMLYDVASNSWDQAFPDLNLARRNHAGAFLPFGPGGGGLPGVWVWGGRQVDDATILTTPEYYGFATASPLIFADGFETGSTVAWSSAVP